MNWIVEALKEKTFRATAIILPVASFAWDVVISLVAREVVVAAIPLGLGVTAIMFLIAYIYHKFNIR